MVVALLATGCASALKHSAQTATPTSSTWQANSLPTTYEYIVLADGTVLASPITIDAKPEQFSSPVISSVHINAEYR